MPEGGHQTCSIVGGLGIESSFGGIDHGIATFSCVGDLVSQHFRVLGIWIAKCLRFGFFFLIFKFFF